MQEQSPQDANSMEIEYEDANDGEDEEETDYTGNN
jgi:hypothetical protein